MPRAPALAAIAVLVGAAVAAAQVPTLAVLVRIEGMAAPGVRCGGAALYADVPATVMLASGGLAVGSRFRAHVLHCGAIPPGCYQLDLTAADVEVASGGGTVRAAGGGALSLHSVDCP